MATTHRLRVTISGIEPAIWREIEIDSDSNLRELHEALQSAFGWQRRHLWRFEFGDRELAPPELELDGVGDDRRVRLGEVLPAAGTRGLYVYDMGDDWAHEIEAVAITPGRPARPRCLAGGRSAPPEDCGGVPGYEDLLVALGGGGGEHGDELRRWARGFDPERFTARAADRRMAKLPPRLGPRRI